MTAGSIGRVSVSLLFVATLAVTIPCLEANIGEFDDHLRHKAEEARRAALEAYHPDPFSMTSNFNLEVHTYVLIEHIYIYMIKCNSFHL